MGLYDWAKTCDLVGIYMLSLITSKFKDQAGLYHDDGLAVCKAMPKQIEKTKQEVSEIFKANGLKITIEANKKTINFLDVTLDLSSGSYKPFMKPNNKILYVHQESNHPPHYWKTSRKTSINDWPASHLARKFSTTRSHRTRKRLTRAATTTSSHTTHSQRATEIAKEKSFGTIPHGTLTWKLTWEESS